MGATTAAPGRAVLITGTDTGIGKTTVAGLWLADLRERQGIDAAYLKPVETGVPPDEPADAAAVRALVGPHVPVRCPVTLSEPLAPAVAAARAGTALDLDALAAELDGMRARHDLVLVEGAGGLLVPLLPAVTFADVAAAWQLPLLLVVGNRLGCLNHALLTVEVDRRRGLELAGWVLNELAPAAERSIAQQTNAEVLIERLGPPLATVDFPRPERVSFRPL